MKDLHGKTQVARIKADATLTELKRVAENKTSVPVHLQRLVVGAEELTPDKNGMSARALKLDGKAVELKLRVPAGAPPQQGAVLYHGEGCGIDARNLMIHDPGMKLPEAFKGEAISSYPELQCVSKASVDTAMPPDLVPRHSHREAMGTSERALLDRCDEDANATLRSLPQAGGSRQGKEAATGARPTSVGYTSPPTGEFRDPSSPRPETYMPAATSGSHVKVTTAGTLDVQS